MIALLSLTLLGFLLGLALGGSLAGWRNVRIHWWLPVVAALIVQLVLYNPPFDSQPWALTFGPYIFIACKAVLVLALLVNAHTAASSELRNAWLVATAGVALNLLVVAANGGYMPQSEAARASIRGVTLMDEGSQPKLRNVTAMDESTRLAFLGDAIAQPAWFPRSNVVSLGDLLLAAGLGLWAFQVTLRVRRSCLATTSLADS
jgi:uncharacterized protein DUF5317